MCIGIPMQVIRTEPGHALCQGRDRQHRINTALVGVVQPGDWLLVFIDSAQARITPERACEVNATLDLLQAVMAGDPRHPAGHAAGPAAGLADAAFDLPSRMTQNQLRALAGLPTAAVTETVTVTATETPATPTPPTTPEPSPEHT